MIAGGLSKNLSAKRASDELRKVRPAHAIGIERKRIAGEFLHEVRRHDRALVELHGRINDAVKAADTSVTDVFGVGPIVACYLIGHSGDVRWFPSAGHSARFNATAPIEASSARRCGHRLNPNGNRATQPCDPCRRARSDQSRDARPRLLPRQAKSTGSGRTIRRDFESSAAGRSLKSALLRKSLPNLIPTLRRLDPGVPRG
jgi:transposase